MKSHSNAFDGLLALIPAKYYYDDDTKTQWNRKKQTKDQAKVAKKTKFDPESLSTAGEVHKERAANAKPAALPPTRDSIKQRMENNETDEDEENEEEIPELRESELASQEDHPYVNGKRDIGQSAESLEDNSDAEETQINLVYDDEGNALDKEKEAKSMRRKAGEPKIKPDPQRIQALRAKLAARIQELREKRKAPGTSVRGAPLNREAILEARRERVKTNKEKLVLKRKRAEEENENENEGDSEFENDELKDNISEDESSGVLSKGTTRINGSVNDYGPKKSGKGSHAISGRGELADEKAGKLEDVDPVKNSKLDQKEGEKLQNDEKLAKKLQKKQKKLRKKSDKERSEIVSKGPQARQQKRDENIALKRERNKKSKKSQKRAGFEGRRSGNKKVKKA